MLLSGNRGTYGSEKGDKTFRVCVFMQFCIWEHVHERSFSFPQKQRSSENRLLNTDFMIQILEQLINEGEKICRNFIRWKRKM